MFHLQPPARHQRQRPRLHSPHARLARASHRPAAVRHRRRRASTSHLLDRRDRPSHLPRHLSPAPNDAHPRHRVDVSHAQRAERASESDVPEILSKRLAKRVQHRALLPALLHRASVVVRDLDDKISILEPNHLSSARAHDEGVRVPTSPGRNSIAPATTSSHAHARPRRVIA